MDDLKTSLLIEELEKDDWAKGDLCLIIACTKCDAMFQLNNQVVALAIMCNVSFIEYAKTIQNEKCPLCHPKDENMGK